MAYQAAFKNSGAHGPKMHVHPEPTFIEFKGLKFLITETPLPTNLQSYIQELKKRNVTTLVRVCEPSYQLDEICKVGIAVHDLYYKDGTRPSPKIIEQWFEIVQNHYNKTPENCIAVHCVAGLGRAPVMVAMSLIELGLSAEDVIELIRNNRHGAFNIYQLEFLENYKAKSRLKMKNGCMGYSNCCIQ